MFTPPKSIELDESTAEGGRVRFGESYLASVGPFGMLYTSSTFRLFRNSSSLKFVVDCPSARLPFP